MFPHMVTPKITEAIKSYQKEALGWKISGAGGGSTPPATSTQNLHPMQRRSILPYSAHLKEYARKLRNHSTRSEIFMWKQLKGKQLKGYDFHRQKPIGHFIVDLYCPELLLAIELDGITHESEEVKQKDKRKQAALEALGVTVLHFTDKEVFFDTDRVFKVLEDFIAAFELMHPKEKPLH